MATTIDLRATTANSESLAGANTITKKVDFTDNVAAATDIRQLFNLEKGQRIMVKLETVTGQGDTCTVDLVTTESSPQTLLDDSSIQTAAAIAAPVTIWTISEDCVLNMLCNSTTTIAVVNVSVTMLDQ
jgi:hypothetical protein